MHQERVNWFKENVKFEENAHNDWRKSQWKLELERIYHEEPDLLEQNEKEMVKHWLDLEAKGEPLPATYCATDKFTPETSIKSMDYYRKNK